MKGRRALPTAEALTGQKPRQRLTPTVIIRLLLTWKPSKPTVIADLIRNLSNR